MECLKCGSHAVCRMSIDLDTQGIAVCEQHVEWARRYLVGLLVEVGRGASVKDADARGRQLADAMEEKENLARREPRHE